MTKTLVVALSVAVLASGCSVVLQERPLESTFGYADKSCSTSSKYWIADAVIAGVATSAAIGGRLYADAEPEQEAAAYSLAGLSALVAVVYAASAGAGRGWGRACGEQIAARTASR